MIVRFLKVIMHASGNWLDGSKTLSRIASYTEPNAVPLKLQLHIPHLQVLSY